MRLVVDKPSSEKRKQPRSSSEDWGCQVKHLKVHHFLSTEFWASTLPCLATAVVLIAKRARSAAMPRRTHSRLPAGLSFSQLRSGVGRIPVLTQSSGASASPPRARVVGTPFTPGGINRTVWRKPLPTTIPGRLPITFDPVAGSTTATFIRGKSLKSSPFMRQKTIR